VAITSLPTCNLTEMLKTKDDRFARHRLISGFSQDRLSALRIAVVGAGAVGNEILKNCLLMGVGSVDVFDFDTTEISNLTRSVFLRAADVGINKAQAVVARAQELHPETRLTAVAGAIAKTLPLSRFAQYDLVVAAVDNIEARLRINDMALITGVTWINVAIDARSAMIEIFPNSAKTQACYACNLPDSAFERIAQRYSCGGLQRAASIQRTVPTTAITASAAGALATGELLRHLHTASQDSQRVFLDTVTPSVSRAQLSSASAERGCPGCGVHASPRRLEISSQALQQAIADAPDQAVYFCEPVIIGCLCNQCGASERTSVSLSKMLYQCARDYTDAAMQCLECGGQSMNIDIRESLSSTDYLAHFHDSYPACAWLIHGERYFDLITMSRNLS
jgi:molybdopterin-synthase adenylyltransferase